MVNFSLMTDVMNGDELLGRRSIALCFRLVVCCVSVVQWSGLLRETK